MAEKILNDDERDNLHWTMDEEIVDEIMEKLMNAGYYKLNKCEIRVIIIEENEFDTHRIDISPAEEVWNRHLKELREKYEEEAD
ncbi:hypothetical protein SAMN05421493_1186 [Pseudobutyrivibrio sp. 49]|uniref:hypothetical protein n=1 Tax=Pseudobutyrivibrio sp. 49 TaxID=1855344 RepID=UPI00087FB1F1|nr:hypothetical protein [Pseudobutyrivibrio sp. 49]SDI55735.1 hypothetical protein SAMN05421493_1186 [Pseudobutyrivibrio sp. 49]